jgi:hydrogenase-4 membrane subunit HyfE
MLSSLLILAVVFVFFIFKHFQKPASVFLIAAILASWTVYGAAKYLQWNILSFITQALDFELVLNVNIEARVAGSPAHVLITQARLIFSAIIAIFAFCGLILTWKRGKIGNVEKRILLILVGIFLLLPFFTYGGELFMRLFLFSLIPLSYFISKGLNQKILLCLFAIFLIAVAPSLHIIAHYGNEISDYVPQSENKGVEFFYKATSEGYVIFHPKRDPSYHQSYEYTPLWRTKWENNALSLEQGQYENLDRPRFTIISYGTREYYNFFLAEPQTIIGISRNLSESIYYNEIYSNPNFEVYIQLPR